MKSCGCSSSSKYGERNFTFRSNTPVNNTDKDLSNFLASADFATYNTNYPNQPILVGQERLVTFNNSTIQALWLTAVDTDTEKQVLFTFYELGKTNYLTFVINSSGTLGNLIDMQGTFNWTLPNKAVFINGTFTASKWDTLSKCKTGAVGIPNELVNGGIVDCIIGELNDMGLGAWIACCFDPEVCLLAISIDCAWRALK
jgi:hypothetical protein